MNGYHSKSFSYNIIKKELDKRLNVEERRVYEGPEGLKININLLNIGNVMSSRKAFQGSLN
jgi:hypothetical protein